MEDQRETLHIKTQVFTCKIKLTQKHEGYIVLEHKLMGTKTIPFKGRLDRTIKPHHMNFSMTGYVEKEYLPEVYAKQWLDEWNAIHTKKII